MTHLSQGEYHLSLGSCSTKGKMYPKKTLSKTKEIGNLEEKKQRKDQSPRRTGVQ